MQQLQLTIDQDSQLLNELVSAVRSPTLSRSAKLAEIGRILAHFDLPIEAPRVAGQLWSATELARSWGSAPRPLAGWPTSTNSNARRSGSTALTRRQTPASKFKPFTTTSSGVTGSSLF